MKFPGRRNKKHYFPVSDKSRQEKEIAKNSRSRSAHLRVFSFKKNVL